MLAEPPIVLTSMVLSCIKLRLETGLRTPSPLYPIGPVARNFTKFPPSLWHGCFHWYLQRPKDCSVILWQTNSMFWQQAHWMWVRSVNLDALTKSFGENQPLRRQIHMASPHVGMLMANDKGKRLSCSRDYCTLRSFDLSRWTKISAQSVVLRRR